jgi:hypothetical protein
MDEDGADGECEADMAEAEEPPPPPPPPAAAKKKKKKKKDGGHPETFLLLFKLASINAMSDDFSSNDRSASDPTTNRAAHIPSLNPNRDTELGSSTAPIGTGNYKRDDNLNRGSELGENTRQREFDRHGADYTASGVDSRGGYGSTGLSGNTTTADTMGGALGENRSGVTGHGVGDRSRIRDYDDQQSSDSNKPGVGDRVVGSVQKAAGQMTGNRERVERGEQRRTGSDKDTY